VVYPKKIECFLITLSGGQ